MNVLAPEPITLADDESASSLGPTAALNVLRAHVTDCTVVSGENGSKFAVWKVTLELQRPDAPADGHPSVAIYKRYSEFRRFRDQLARRCPASDLPQLPPRVSWYQSWRYQDVNLDRAWLARRRQGLDYFLNKILLDQTLVAANRELIVRFLEPQPAANGL
ncbi:hypothetical protein HG536_0E00730 [Torulaspora globosa]|uniref:Endosomal/vacuolar adapter protein YPT35 n=1 Tax=Torulaspora globosa TaxID=48254 RepID=A0A7G3ZI27_9SACH|nr:uncharacterized protein HG536_0E00730 [Torulaspora globosa]QLL33163.1 hypothetical protein HG536_0E00730 [Torulaspora globosa]